MKNLKFPALLSLFFVFHSCQQHEEAVLPEKEQLVVVTNIDPKSDDHIMEMLSSTVYGAVGATSRVMTSSIGEISLDEAMVVEHQVDGVTRYTFRMDSDKPLMFTNLIIKETQRGEVSGYRISYRPDFAWLQAKQGEASMKDFTGFVIFSYLNGEDHYMMKMVNGQEHSYLYPSHTSSRNGRTAGDCNGNGNGGGSGGGGTFGSNPYGAGYVWDGTEVAYVGGGGGSGMSDDGETINYRPLPPPEDIPARKACSPSDYPESSKCSKDDSVDAIYEECTSPVGVLSLDILYVLDPGSLNLCDDNLKFKHIGNSFTAEVAGLGVSVWDRSTLKPVVNAELGVSCISLPEYNISTSAEAGVIFSEIFNYARKEIFFKINSGQLALNTFSVRSELTKIIKNELSRFFPGSSFSNGSCYGNIPTSIADYGC